MLFNLPYFSKSNNSNIQTCICIYLVCKHTFLSQAVVHHSHQQQGIMGSGVSAQHRGGPQQYDGAMNKVSIQQYQSPLAMGVTSTSPRPQSARCFIQTKGQKSMDGFPEQVLSQLSHSYSRCANLIKILAPLALLVLVLSIINAGIKLI